MLGEEHSHRTRRASSVKLAPPEAITNVSVSITAAPRILASATDHLSARKRSGCAENTENG